MQTLLSFAGIVVAVVPLFFISRALQPLMSEAIRGEGDQYFGFLLIGMICMSTLPIAVASIPNAVNGAISSGTLESLLDTPTSVPGVLAGLISYEVVFTALRMLLLAIVGGLFGAAILWSRLPLAALVVGLIVLVHVPIGLLAAAGVLAFRTAGPIPQGVLVLSGLLGGAYYPTHVIPGWLESVSQALPLSYGLRALRRVMMQEHLDFSVWSDVLILVVFAIPLWSIGVWVFAVALRHARRCGQLSRY